jgi:hypothetical protein
MHRHRRLVLASAALLGLLGAGTAARAQQYWLPNGPGGTTWNNPQGSLSGTIYENMLQRRAFNYRHGLPQPEDQAAAAGRPVAPRGGGGGATQAAVADPSFRLTNRSAATLNELYVSSATDSNWGADRLGQGVLPGGRQLVVRLPMGQCVNDIRAVYAGGRVIERRRVDTCALTDLHLP